MQGADGRISPDNRYMPPQPLGQEDSSLMMLRLSVTSENGENLRLARSVCLPALTQRRPLRIEGDSCHLLELGVRCFHPRLSLKGAHRVRSKAITGLKWMVAGLATLSMFSLLPFACFLATGGARLLAAADAQDMRIVYSYLGSTWWEARLYSTNSDLSVSLTWFDQGGASGAAGATPASLRIPGAGHSMLLMGQETDALQRFAETLGRAPAVDSYQERLSLYRAAANYVQGGLSRGMQSLVRRDRELPPYLVVPTLSPRILGQVGLSWQLPILALIPLPHMVNLIWAWVALLCVTAFWPIMLLNPRSA